MYSTTSALAAGRWFRVTASRSSWCAAATAAGALSGGRALRTMPASGVNPRLPPARRHNTSLSSMNIDCTRRPGRMHRQLYASGIIQPHLSNRSTHGVSQTCNTSLVRLQHHRAC